MLTDEQEASFIEWLDAAIAQAETDATPHLRCPHLTERQAEELLLNGRHFLILRQVKAGLMRIKLGQGPTHVE